MQAYTPLFTISPYVIHHKPVADENGSAPESDSNRKLQIIYIAAAALIGVALLGFSGALAFPVLCVPSVVIASSACLATAIAVLAFAIFSEVSEQRAADIESGTTTNHTAVKPTNGKPTKYEPNEALPKEFTILQQVAHAKAKAHDAPMNVKEEVLYREEAQVEVSKPHYIARVSAIVLAVIATIGAIVALAVVLVPFAPLVPWVTLIAIGSASVFAAAITIYALSIFSIYEFQQIPTDKANFERNRAGARMAQTMVKDLPKEQPKESVYLDLANYKKFLEIDEKINASIPTIK